MVELNSSTPSAEKNTRDSLSRSGKDLCEEIHGISAFLSRNSLRGDGDGKGLLVLRPAKGKGDTGRRQVRRSRARLKFSR